MATFKKPRKEKHAAIYNDERGTGPEPVWDTEKAKKLKDLEFDIEVRRSLNYYNYHYTPKETVKYVVKWLQENTKLKAAEIRQFGRSNGRMFPMTACGLVMAARKGMPFRKRHTEYVLKKVKDLLERYGSSIDAADEEQAKKPTAKVMTIQDRLAEKTNAVIGEIEGEVDNAFKNRPQQIKIYDFITSRNVPQAQIGKIRAVFQKQIDELAEAIKGKDEQLKEGYSHLKKADFARIASFYKQLMTDLDAYTQVKKTTKKVRVKKTPTKEKMISKVKYLKESKELKIASISPADVIGSQAVWVYHTKYRKLGKYVAADHATLGIKGTTIINYNENLSVAKTLRKPAEQLKEFMKAGKVALRTFLKDIKATETRLNGRLNAEILLLKVE